MALILVANPGSASRKYALYNGDQCLAKLHFEYVGSKIICGWEVGDQKGQSPVSLSHISFAASQLPEFFSEHKLTDAKRTVDSIALRVVAPTVYFQKDRLINKALVVRLTELEPTAPLHINATLQEISMLAKCFPRVTQIAISDSAFHHTLPDRASHYGLPLGDAQKLGLKRFGYQGISVESTVERLKQNQQLPARLIVCHLGSGSSVTAVRDGKSIDTTMGYSPLEGLIMATRSGSVDATALLNLKQQLDLTDNELQSYLNQKSGLLGISGVSSDIRELLELEAKNPRAALALDLYAYRAQQAIGQMAASLGGVDAVAFTGTVGERSVPMRRRIIHGLLFLGLALDPALNHSHIEPGEMARISPADHPAKIYITPADEASVMAARVTRV